jgi:hypothetical protein
MIESISSRSFMWRNWPVFVNGLTSDELLWYSHAGLAKKSPRLPL